MSGYVPEVLDQEVEKIKQKYEPLLKDPVNTIGGIGQSICDTADEKGVAYSSGYIVAEVVTALLADKGLDKIKNVAKTGKTADNVADIAEGAAKGAGNAAEDAGKAGKGLEEATKGAESAAEDAGKVVETSYGKSREIIQCNTKDAAADELAKRIGGQSRSAFADDPIQREFDVISDQYIAQAKPPLKCVNKTVRTQMKATFEAAKKYERKVYYQFEGIPSQEVLDKLYEYSERYGVEVIIDTEPLGILN